MNVESDNMIATLMMAMVMKTATRTLMTMFK